MKCLRIYTGLALGGWLAFVPLDFTHAQAGRTDATGNTAAGTTSSGGIGATTGVGGGVGGQYGGSTGRTYADYIGGSQQGTGNLNNAGDYYRGQGVDRAGDEPFANDSRPQRGSSRFNDGIPNSRYSRPNFYGQSNDRLRSRAEQLNDGDDFQSDPYQSSRSSRDSTSQLNEMTPSNGLTYDRRRDAIERRRYQEDRLLADKDPEALRRWNRYSDRFNDRSRYQNDDPDINVFVDDDGYGYGDGYYDDGNYTGNIYVPDRVQMDRIDRGARRNRVVEPADAPPRLRVRRSVDPSADRGAGNFDQLPSSGARKQSLDRAANHVNANLGRDADDELDADFPANSGIEAGRKLDARVDPRGR